MLAVLALLMPAQYIAGSLESRFRVRYGSLTLFYRHP